MGKKRFSTHQNPFWCWQNKSLWHYFWLFCLCKEVLFWTQTAIHDLSKKRGERGEGGGDGGEEEGEGEEEEEEDKEKEEMISGENERTHEQNEGRGTARANVGVAKSE